MLESAKLACCPKGQVFSMAKQVVLSARHSGRGKAPLLKKEPALPPLLNHSSLPECFQYGPHAPNKLLDSAHSKALDARTAPSHLQAPANRIDDPGKLHWQPYLLSHSRQAEHQPKPIAQATTHLRCFDRFRCLLSLELCLALPGLASV